MLLRAGLMLALLLALACGTPGTRDRPFTDDWAYARGRIDTAPEVGGDIFIAGGGGKVPQTVLHVDEEGTPALQIGSNSRWRTEVSVDGGGPAIHLKYKRKF